MLTKKELSEYLKVSTYTIERMLDKGLPYHKLGTSTAGIRFKIEEVEAWTKENANR